MESGRDAARQLALSSQSLCFRPASGYQAYKRAGTSTQAGRFKYLGEGHCERGFYAGWRAEEASLKRCTKACSNDPRCVAFALLPGKSCSRYDSAAGDCLMHAPSGKRHWLKR